jgi:hypothetical protein
LAYNAGQPPTPSSESTAIEIRRIEGSVRSYIAIGTITAGHIVKLGTSGIIQTVGGEDNTLVAGAAFYTATSGNRVVVGKGQLNCFWDGVGTVNIGTQITPSTTNSGWFTAATAGSGAINIGFYEPLPGGVALVAGNSGTKQPVRIW